MESTERDMASPNFGPNLSEPPAVLGGFDQSVGLLDFQQIRSQLASYTRTVMGREAGLSLAPSRDLMEVASRQQETTESRQFLENGGSLEFGPDIDFREYAQRALLGGLLRGDELYAIRELVGAARFTRNNLVRHEELPLLSGYADSLPDLGAIEQAIASAISPAGEVLDNASPMLRDLRQESRDVHQRLNEVMERNLRRFQRQEVVQEPIITQRNGRLVLLIKAEMRSRVQGIVHDVSDSGATVFVEPMPAIDLGNRWREARLAEEREVERVLRQLSSLVSQSGEELLLTLDLLSRLDLGMAKGRYSLALRATAPWVADQEVQDRRFSLIGARHPLLTGEVVPVSVELGPDSGIMLITGPNAGGKTVTLKTVGLLALMAHAGLHVPADEAHIPRLDGVYADIGDQQSIEQALSTFSSHISNLLNIMGKATVHSLVLVDELGTSTDPEEGSALATAILSHFMDLGTLLVATTHHRGVAHFVQETPGMVNASVDLDPQTLKPTYRVTLGLPGRSYALTIAARLGLPQDIIDRARSWMSPVEQATENLLQELQRERQVVEQLRQESEAALAESRQQQAEAEARLASVESTKVELVEEARQELQVRIGDLLQRLRQAEHTLDQPGDRAAVQEQRAQLEEARRQVVSTHWQPIEVKRVNWQDRIKGGDRVLIRGIQRPVEVINPPDEEGQVEVLLGTMRAKIPVYQLERPAPGVHQPAARQGVYFNRPARRQTNTEIDLRGLRVDEALERVEGLLNNASLDGVDTVRIIHGKGTGALRRSVREYLQGHPLAGAVNPEDDPGDDGVTVVALK
ncbi:MAG: endonuclease MutS2 [Chloroflexi bacterium]|nr:endonuclease MutS2 [Chloroflexota bacterium]